MLRSVFSVGCLLLGTFGKNVLLKPIKEGQEASFVLLQGAGLKPDQYVPLATAIQQASNLKLWVAIPEAPGDLENPLVVAKTIKAGLSDLASAGCTTNTSFMAGHSLGAVFLQDWVKTNSATVTAQVLMGASLSRKQRTAVYPVPTLAIAGELDGLYRITRMAEEYYHRSAQSTFPVVVIEGMDHMQWASGAIPFLVRERDLEPEISYDEAHAAGAKAIAAFLASSLGIQSDVAQQVRSTGTLLAPIIKAYELEGARYWNRPQQKGGPLEDCPKGGCMGPGTAYTIQVQEMIGNTAELEKEGWTFNISDQFVQLSALPPFGAFHLPVLTHSGKASKQIDLTTYSQDSWEKLDGLDTGFAPTSAIEIAAKMMSRQCVAIRGANHSEASTPFSVDNASFCAEANENVYNWAIKNAGPTTAARFAKKGERYVFAPDAKKSGGPFWIDTLLGFKSITLSSGEKVVEITAPMIKTSIDFPKIPLLPDPACYHYCKLLSPARAMEWLYVDGLRLHDGLNSTSSR